MIAELAASVSAASVTFSHTYTAVGSWQWRFDVTDPDGGSGFSSGVLNVQPVVDIDIANGGLGTLFLSEISEDSLGAFTLTNWNDTDLDGTIDSNEHEILGDVVPGEVDLMRLKVHKPPLSIFDPANPNVMVAYPDGQVWLWADSNKSTAIPDSAPGIGEVDVTVGDREIWVAVIDVSSAIRDITLTASYAGESDSVSATGIWATRTAFVNSQGNTTVAAGSSGNLLKVASVVGFAAGNRHVHVFHAGAWQRLVMSGVNAGASALVLTETPTTTFAVGEIVRQGYTEEVDKVAMLESFELRGAGGFFGSGRKQDGAFLGTNATFYNSMLMEFTLQPTGIAEVIKNQTESGIKVDITRQRLTKHWQYVDATTLFADFPETSGSHTGDIPSDDAFNTRDEDVEAFESGGTVSDKIFSRDMPGVDNYTAPWYRTVYRLNMQEFVRIRFDDTNFANQNGLLEGSRASDKEPWRSWMDIIADANGKWIRNPGAPAGSNLIQLGNSNLNNPVP